MSTLHPARIVTAIGIVSALSFFLPFSAQAIEYGGIGGKPAFPSPDNPRTQSIFIHTLSPGATTTDGVVVVNNTTDTKTIMVYGADSTPSTDGAFACKQLAEDKTDVGAWITLTQSELTLAPGTNGVIPFTIAVPENVSVGEHNGCVLIQEKKDPVPGQSGAVLSVRTGIRVAITIPGVIVRTLDVVGFTATPSNGGISLQPVVKNTGNVSIDAVTKVVTQYFFGIPYATDGGQFPILRGDTSQWNFDLKNPFWGGWYHSDFTVSYDENAAAGVGVTSGQPLTTLAAPSVWFFVPPSPVALAVEIVVLLAVVVGVALLLGLQLLPHTHSLGAHAALRLKKIRRKSVKR